MLGLAVNRQPGFRLGLVEQSNASKKNLAACWLADCSRLLNASCCRLLAAATWLTAGHCNLAGSTGLLATNLSALLAD